MAYMKRGAEPKRRRILTGKQLRFIEEFCNPASEGYQVGSRAVRMAGYKVSPGNANRLAVELMAHPKISKEIADRMKERRENLQLSAEYVINKLIEIVEDTEKDADKLRGLELLGKHLGLYKDRQEISGPDGKAIEMEQRTKENAEAFTSRIARLATAGGKGEVVKFPDGSREG